jgi:hypothetical protein
VAASNKFRSGHEQFPAPQEGFRLPLVEFRSPPGEVVICELPEKPRSFFLPHWQLATNNRQLFRLGGIPGFASAIPPLARIVSNSGSNVSELCALERRKGQ